MAVAATTELACINIMLAAIGEAPINSLAHYFLLMLVTDSQLLLK